MLGKIVPDIVNNQKLYSTSETTSVREAARIMSDVRIGALVVLKDDRLVGIVTERDLTTKVIAEGKDASATPVADVMTRDPDTLEPGDSPLDALELMRVRGYRHLPVVEGGKFVAMVSVRNLYAAIQTQLEDDVRQREAFMFDTGYGAGN